MGVMGRGLHERRERRCRMRNAVGAVARLTLPIIRASARVMKQHPIRRDSECESKRGEDRKCGWAVPCVHDEGAGRGYAAAEAEQGLEHVANVGAAALPKTSAFPAGHIEVSLKSAHYYRII
jgi:hypothetical protein